MYLSDSFAGKLVSLLIWSALTIHRTPKPLATVSIKEILRRMGFYTEAGRTTKATHTAVLSYVELCSPLARSVISA